MTHILDTAQTTARYQDINKQEFLDQVKDLDLIPFKVEVEKVDEDGNVEEARIEFPSGIEAPDGIVQTNCADKGRDGFRCFVWYRDGRWSADASYEFNSGQNYGGYAANPDESPEYPSLREAAEAAEGWAESLAEELDLRCQEQTHGRRGEEFENEGITFILTQDARWAKRSAKRAGA